MTAPDQPLSDQRLVDAARLVFDLGLSSPVTITDLDDPRLDGIGRVAAAAGFHVAYLVPIKAPNGPEIVGAMVVWGRTTVEFQVGHQTPHPLIPAVLVQQADRALYAATTSGKNMVCLAS